MITLWLLPAALALDRRERTPLDFKQGNLT